MTYELAKYKNQWALFDRTARCFVLFGKKRILIKRMNELNKR